MQIQRISEMYNLRKGLCAGDWERAAIFLVTEETEKCWAQGEEKGGKRKFLNPNSNVVLLKPKIKLLWVQLNDRMAAMQAAPWNTASILAVLLLLFCMHVELLWKNMEKVCKRDIVSKNMGLNYLGFPGVLIRWWLRWALSLSLFKSIH